VTGWSAEIEFVVRREVRPCGRNPDDLGALEGDIGTQVGSTAEACGGT
jgi:hypothetical protein